MDLIPAPVEAHRHADIGHFELRPGTALSAGPGAEPAARWLRSVLGAATGFALLPGDSAGDGSITLRLDPEVTAELGAEGYRLSVAPGQGVRIDGGGPAGLFWGAQTLRQLLGAEAYRRAPLPGRSWRLPYCDIADAPRFAWRGVLLDVARHFMPKDVVLRYVDLLASHKLNVLHLHLTDDQGWRVEIRRHPRLTEVGSWRTRTKVGLRESPLWDERPHGGHYTHDDIREIVAYAAERHVTVVPEIDIPGHSQAAIAAYPELGVTDVVDTTALEVLTGWGINPNVLAPVESTLRFYEDVLTEVLALFPSTFVHLGGDECPKDQWKASAVVQARIKELGLRDEDELQSWFVRHFDRWLADRGRRLIGWDEILEGGAGRGKERPQGERVPGDETTAYGLTPGAAVSSWRGYEGGIAAARAGHDVVMCPESQVYLDWRQAPGDDEPVPIAHVRTLEDVYRFEPVPDSLGPREAARVIGAQANIWTETMDTVRAVDYMAFPRLAAFAETAWSPLPAPAERDVEGFLARMATHYGRLDALGVEYRPPGGPLPWQRRPGVVGRPIEGPPPIV
ncbi:beta-N-acetylhexosaminidase [Streptomyces sp. NPDC046977]|uniref:beta-N-acetylhexosaminidase n=1 Tax=Streptomyces sp. NPDC046977 TaxID=3154703 RepID=UPI0034014EE6